MKKILIPTDFSEAALSAYHYALEYCKTLGGPVRVKLVHVFMPEAMATPTLIPPAHEFLAVKEQSLQEFAKMVGEYASNITKVDTELLVGFPTDEVVTLSERYDLVVMGATGSGGFLEKLFGSTAGSVAQRAHCPVLLIPEGTKYKAPRQILYASNIDSADKRLIEQLETFNENFKARVHFVHIQQGDGAEEVHTKEGIFDDLFDQGEPSFAFEFADIKSSDVSTALNHYATEKQIDLLAMATRQRSFWEQLFHKSQTQQMAIEARLPLLVLHPGD